MLRAALGKYVFLDSGKNSVRNFLLPFHNAVPKIGYFNLFGNLFFIDILK